MWLRTPERYAQRLGSWGCEDTRQSVEQLSKLRSTFDHVPRALVAPSLLGCRYLRVICEKWKPRDILPLGIRQIADKKKAPEGAFNQALNLIRLKLEGERPLRFNFDLRAAVEITLQEWR